MDASLITTLRPDAKPHVMKSLAALSKFAGIYDSWLVLIKRYNLKWSKRNGPFATFKSIFEENGNVIEDIIDIYSWMTSCSKAIGGMPR